MLSGFTPAVTETLSRTAPPGKTDAGEANPMPEGSVGIPGWQATAGEELFRGAGLPRVKSLELSFVSVQPLPLRIAAVVFESTSVGPLPSKQFALPKPTKSVALGHVPVSAAVESTRATFPLVADIVIVPVASGVGRLTVPPAPCAC